MTFKTKYKIGDTFWKLNNQRAQSYVVGKINITVWGRDDKKPSVDILYLDTSELSYVGVYEREFYTTKEQLIKSI